MEIRPAAPGDLAALVRLGTAMRAESAVRFPPVDPAAVAAHLELVAAHPDRLCAALAWRREAACGFVHGALGGWPFSAEPRAGCELLYVAPANRGGPAAVALLRHFLDWAARNGARSVCLGLSTGVAPERAARLLEKLGFAPLGPTYRKEIDPCAPASNRR